MSTKFFDTNTPLIFLRDIIEPVIYSPHFYFDFQLSQLWIEHFWRSSSVNMGYVFFANT